VNANSGVGGVPRIRSSLCDTRGLGVPVAAWMARRVMT
jgi:hypothetical protein